MNWLGETWTGVWTGVPWAVIAALVLWWIRDRRKDRAAAAVAEQTVDADVTVKDIGAQDARLLYAVKAFDAERASLQRQIDECGRQLERKDRQLEAKDAELDHAQTVIARLRVQIEELQGRLDDVRQELTRFAEQHDARGQDGAPA